MELERLLPADALRPRWSSAAFLVYAGAFVVLAATASLLGILAEDHGNAAPVGYSALAAGIALGLAFVLEQAGRALAAGVAATLAVVFFAILVGALENLVGLIDAETETDDYQPGLLIVEALTIVAAVAALRRFRAPLLVLPAAGVFWIAVADIGSVFSWGDADELLSLLVGALLAAGGVVLDRRALRPYAFWLHVLGGVAFGGSLLALADSDGGWILVGLVSLGYVGAAWGLDRSSYAVLGALGIVATTTYFIQDGLGFVGFVVPLDVGEEGGIDPWEIALYYVFTGLLIAALGLLVDRVARVRVDAEA